MFRLTMTIFVSILAEKQVPLDLKGPHRPDAIWQRDANFGFLLTSKPFNFF